jgi:hypothetical protein
VAGEWLARTVVRERYVPVLLDVYDRLALEQSALEQALYGHLYRLALGDERNWCRVSRRELGQRTRLSERRLGKALAGLVDRGHIRLVQRDRRGTLYRVVLPHEVFGEAAPDAVHVARRAPGAADKKSAPWPATPSRAPAPTSAKTSAKTGPRKREPPPLPRAIAAPDRPHKAYKKSSPLDPSSVGSLAASFIARFSERPGRSRAEVVEEILGRLEEGQSLEETAVELERFGSKAPKATPISELARFLERGAD